MKARRQLLQSLDVIIANHQDSGAINAVTILKEQLKDGSLTKEELKDTIIEMLFSAFHGEFQVPRLPVSITAAIYLPLL